MPTGQYDRSKRKAAPVAGDAETTLITSASGFVLRAEARDPADALRIVPLLIDVSNSTWPGSVPFQTIDPDEEEEEQDDADTGDDAGETGQDDNV